MLEGMGGAAQPPHACLPQGFLRHGGLSSVIPQAEARGAQLPLHFHGEKPQLKGVHFLQAQH